MWAAGTPCSAHIYQIPSMQLNNAQKANDVDLMKSFLFKTSNFLFSIKLHLRVGYLITQNTLFTAHPARSAKM